MFYAIISPRGFANETFVRAFCSRAHRARSTAKSRAAGGCREAPRPSGQMA